MTAQFNAELLGRLAELSADEITQALADIRAEATEIQGQAPTTESVARYNELLGYATQLADERTSRANLATEHAAKFADIDALTAPPADESLADKAKGENGGELGGDNHTETGGSESGNIDNGGDAALADASDSDNKDGDDTDDGAAADDGDDTGKEDSVTASGRRPLGGVNQPPAAAAHPLGQIKMTTTAVGGVAGVEPGQQIDRRQLAEAFAAKGRAVAGRNVRGYERYAVATVRTEYPEDRMLRSRVDAFTNMERVEAIVDSARTRHARDNQSEAFTVQSGPEGANALVAAGLCAPLETLYDIRTIGDTDRPVRDALVRFGADRGGIQYRPALDGVTQTGGIGVWTAANDSADPLVPKTCVEIDCPGIVDAEVDAIYQCLTFSNMSTRFDPEWMDSTIRAQAIAHARFSENRLLTQLTTGSKAVYSTRTLGTTRDTLYTMDRMVAYYRNVHRYNREVPLRWIAPAWMLNNMRADITRQMVGDGLQSLAVTDAAIAQWLGERNVNVTWHLDGIDPADITPPTPDIVVPAQFYTLLAADSPVPDFPAAVSTLLFAEGDWLFLDGGTLDLGVVRDSTLNSQNRFQTFSESFETTAFRGIESIHLVLQVAPTGESAATADTTP